MAANVRLLRRRIKTAKNIKQITKAMEMVSASKMHKAQERTIAGKPYAQKLAALAQNLLGRVENANHPYLEQRENGKILVIIFSPDKGLAGSFPTNILREYLNLKREIKDDIKVIVVGKKLQSTLTHLGTNITATFPFGTSIPRFEAVMPIIQLANEGYLKGEYKQVKVLYTEFETIGRQTAQVINLLPVVRIEEAETNESLLYTFEPNATELLESLMPHYLEVLMYQMFLENYASEQAARMMAMHQASENAKDVITDLTLFYNKVRQEKITSELLDIVTATMVV